MNFTAKGTKAHKDLIKHKKRKLKFQMTGIWSETREENGEEQEMKIPWKVILKMTSKINMENVP